MEKKKAWVWFKGGIKGGQWVGGFMASNFIEEKGFLIEKSDYVSCIVPEWRISFEQPSSESQGPSIPKDATWKYPAK